MDNEEQTLLEYINENVYGLLLFVFVLFIIYYVDYISRINALLFAMPSTIPGMPPTITIPSIHVKRKNKKIKS